MSDIVVFDTTFNLDTTSDVNVDFSAGQTYTSTNNRPWHLSIQVDGTVNSDRGGSAGVSDLISCIGACSQLGAGNHEVKIIWWGDPAITLYGAVLRILVTKR